MSDQPNNLLSIWAQRDFNASLSRDMLTRDLILDAGVAEIGDDVVRRNLFNANEPGVFLDPDHLSTLFQDTAGTTPVTAAGQPVGLVLDKSRGLVLGPELVVNGNFSSGTTGWTDNSTAPATFTAPSGAGLLTSDGVARARARTSFTTVIGRSYRISYTASASVDYAVGTSPAAGDLAAGAGASLSINFIATTTTTHIQISTVTSGVTSFDNISVRELPGNHATQATAGSRPLYALLPANGVRNLANGSASVGNNAVWLTGTTQNGITMTKVASGFDVDGLPYVDVRYQGTSTGTNHDQILPFSFAVQSGVAGQSATCSVIARVISGSVSNVLGFRARVSEETAPSTFIGIALGTPVTASTDTVTTATRTLSTGNQFRATLSLDFNTASAIDVTFRIKAIQLELGSTRTAYQFNYSNVNIAQPPFAQVGALLFDGVDDFLQTPSVDFAGYQILGSELVTNGDFSVDASWTKGTGVTISGGVANFTAGSLWLEQQIVTQAGRVYQVTGTTTNSIFGGAWDNAGQATVLNDPAGVSTATTRNGTFSFTFVAADTTTFIGFVASGAGATTLDNISVKEVLRPADKMTVFAGVRKLSDAARAFVFNQENGGVQRIAFEAPSGAGLGNYAASSGGTINVAAAAAGAAPNTSVLSMSGSITPANLTLRQNGAQAAQNTSTQGTGNYSNQPIFIGRFNGTSFPFNGYLYSLIVRGAATSADLIALTERWVNSKAGAY
ncbi:MAG: hypothetical protein EAZ84_00405 [Verrucomicrobia bacterium]|nr:MAG: hypothetical protein EAZ84_00405 [Verrucomicrobiota bacterium]